MAFARNTFIAFQRLLRYRDLIRTLVTRDLRVRYRRSAIGFLWTMLNPLLSMSVLTVVFSTLFRFDVANYPVYVLAGLIFWNFFSQSITASMNSLRWNAGLLTMLPVPKAVFPLATVLSGLLNLLFGLVPLLLIMAVTGHPLTPALVFLPVAMLLAAIFALGAGLLLSPLATVFSDTVEMVGILLALLMYLTPVFYPSSIVPEDMNWILRFNPVRVVLEVFRTPIYVGTIPSMSQVAVAASVSIGLLIVGSVAFRKSSERLALYL